MPEESLTLVRANKSRSGGHWSDDDYDVHLDNQAPKERPWFWTITARERRPSMDDRGYAVTRASDGQFQSAVVVAMNKIFKSLEPRSRRSTLRELGQSNLVRASVLMPVFGYLLIFNEHIHQYLTIRKRYRLGR